MDALSEEEPALSATDPLTWNPSDAMQARTQLSTQGGGGQK